MEQHLKLLCQNTVAFRHRIIHENAQLMLDTLETQRISSSFKAWQIREKCLYVMKLALESNNPTLCSFGLQGIEYVVLHPDVDGIAAGQALDALDARIFVLQVLDALKTLPSLPSSHQINGLKILLSLCCEFVSSFDGELIIKIVQMCLACRHRDNVTVHSAMIQILAAYTMHMQKLCNATCSQDQMELGVKCAAESLASQAVEKLATADIKGSIAKDRLVDVVGLAKFFVQQINLSAYDNQRAVHLECLLAVLKTLESKHVRKSEVFFSYVRCDLCPTLVSVVSQNTGQSKVQRKSKKGMKKAVKDPVVTSNKMLYKKVALIVVELVRLVGCIASLRPHLAVVFTLFLSPTACSKHGLLYAIFNKLWSSPDMLYDLAGPFLVQDVDIKRNCTNILQQIIDAITLSCCGNETDKASNISNIESAVDCVVSLLETLDKAQQGIGLRTEQVECCSSQLSDDDESALENVHPNTADVESRPNGSVLQHEVDDETEDKQKESLAEKDDSYENEQPLQYLSEDDDVWASSEDIFSSMSSPCYLSAVEDEDSLQTQNGTTLLYGLMRFMAKPSRKRKSSDADDVDNQSDGEASSSSTFVASTDAQEVETEDDISKYLENNIPYHQLTHCEDDVKNSVLAARHFHSIKKLMPNLMTFDTVAAVDQALQEAASHFCSEVYSNLKGAKITLQADSLYTLSYSTLLLCLRLKLSGHYDGRTVQLPCVKSKWVVYQQCSGVYLSKAWLSETFRKIIAEDLLENAVCPGNGIPTLISMLGEIDGFSIDFKNPTSNSTPRKTSKEASAIVTGYEFAKQLLVTIWPDVFQILQWPLLLPSKSNSDNLSSSIFISSPESLHIRGDAEMDCILSSLRGLRTALKLSCSFGFHLYSGTVLKHLIETCVPKDYAFTHRGTKQPPGHHDEDRDLRLHACHVLCLEAVLDVAVTIGSNLPSCWTDIFRLVLYIGYLDHTCFHDASPNFSKEKLRDEGSLQNVDLSELIKASGSEFPLDAHTSSSSQSTRWSVLSPSKSSEAVYALSRNVDRLFEQAATSLNLRCLTDFVWSLCLCSKQHLFPTESNNGDVVLGTPLLYRLGECVLKCTRTPTRPLLHLFSIWQYTAPHFAMVLGHKDTHLAKQAATYVLDVINVVLSGQEENGHHPLSLWRDREPNYFHFVETLLLPYERAVQSDVCSNDVQQLIISSISQLVETSSKQICSGWRPLFSTLKQITFDQHNVDHLSVMDVLNAFFVASNSTAVFASAAHDSINCLFKMLTTSQGDVDSHCIEPSPIFRYLEETANSLFSMFESGCQEKFNKPHQANLRPHTPSDGMLWKNLVTPKWLNHESYYIERLADDLSAMTEKCFSAWKTPGGDETELQSFSDKTGLLDTLFLLLDRLTNIALTASNQIQSHSLNLLCKLLEKCITITGPMFSCHVFLHSCIPALFTWLEKVDVSDRQEIPFSALMNYRHMFGTIMESIVTFILNCLRGASVTDVKFTTTETKHLQDEIKKLCIAYLNLCIACVQTRKEPLSKLGCACIRHFIGKLGKQVTTELVDGLCCCLNYLVDDCLSNLLSLTTLFSLNTNPEEIVCEVKDGESIFCDNFLLTRVFQSSMCFASQKTASYKEVTISHHHASDDNVLTSVSVCDLACDVASLGLLVKCIEFFLLGNAPSPWQHGDNSANHQPSNDGDETVGTSSLHSTSSSDASKNDDIERSYSQPLLEYMNTSQVHGLCCSVAKCFIAARNFDSCRSLKRFLQKLLKFYNAANLFQFASLSLTIYIRILLVLYCQAANADDKPMTIKQQSSSGSDTEGRGLSLEDLIPTFSHHECSDCGMLNSSDALKPSGNQLTSFWSYQALHQSFLLLCHPWDASDESSSVIQSNNEDLFPESGDAASPENNSIKAAKVSYHVDVDDSVDISCDYMAYVKKTESSSQDKLKTTAESHDSKGLLFRQVPFKAAGDKVIGRLVGAYKRHKRRKSNAKGGSSEGDMLDTDADAQSMSSRRSRSASESSFSFLSVVAVDEKTLERQAWSSTVESILRLLTSAPDRTLSRLLPVVYRPLTSLAVHRPMSVVLPYEEGGNDIRDAFHKWLLRVGDFCDFL